MMGPSKCNEVNKQSLVTGENCVGGGESLVGYNRKILSTLLSQGGRMTVQPTVRQRGAAWQRVTRQGRMQDVQGSEEITCPKHAFNILPFIFQLYSLCLLCALFSPFSID